MKLDTNSMRDYDIACALRGSDLPNTDSLKYALTCRIRHLVGCNFAMSRGRRLTVLEAKKAMAEAKKHRKKLAHYLGHAYLAISYLNEPALASLVHELSGGKRIAPEEFIDLAGGDA